MPPKRQLFETLLEGVYESLCNSAMKFAKNKADAEDIVQDAIVRAFINFSPERHAEKFKQWMLTIVRNVAINWYRRGKKKVEYEEMEKHTPEAVEPEEFSPEHLLNLGLSQGTMDALLQIPKAFRPVLLYVDALDVSYADTAQLLGIPEGTVMSRLHRGRRLMFGLLKRGSKWLH